MPQSVCFFGLIGIELGFFQLSLLQALPERVFGIISNDLLLSIPFFTFMGAVLERCGLAEDLLEATGQLFGPIRGGLAYAVILVGALLGAITGTVAASVIAMGLISLPVMMRYGYDMRMATGRHRRLRHDHAADPAFARADRARRSARQVGRRHVCGRDRSVDRAGAALLRVRLRRLDRQARSRPGAAEGGAHACRRCARAARAVGHGSIALPDLPRARHHTDGHRDDLTRLRTITTPQTFTADALYREFGPAHNIAINEETGFAYAIGSNTCRGGPHIVDIQAPKSPTEAGCVSQDGYTHDTQCVVYRGPDEEYQGREICFSSNEDTLTIVDVTDKDNPVQISRKGYSGAQYSHQGWLTEDQRYFLLDDELDESSGTDKRTKTYIWDLADLTNPLHTGVYTSPATAIDHNQYIKGKYSYQANYQAGLRILDIGEVASADLTEVGLLRHLPRG